MESDRSHLPLSWFHVEKGLKTVVMMVTDGMGKPQELGRRRYGTTVEEGAVPVRERTKVQGVLLRQGVPLRSTRRWFGRQARAHLQREADLLRQQRARFVERFGREPGPDDKVFFDLPPEQELKAEMVATMREAGIRPHLIYAYERTGLMVTEENKHLIPQRDLDEYNAVIDQYFDEHGDEEDD
jgi:hypothetical protein